MMRRSRNRERLAALVALGIVLFLPPFLLVFNSPVRVLGIPLLYLYLFGAWALLIGLAAVLAERIESDEASDPQSRNASESPALPTDVRNA